MIVKIADHIISPLGVGTMANYTAVAASRTGLKAYTHLFDCVEPFVASLMEERPKFVDMCIAAVRAALEQTNVDAHSSSVVFVLSTTKGDNLELWSSSQRVTRYFGNTNPPVVVSNACVSGVSAQIVGARLIESGKYKTAIIVGADVQTKFIISGFQSFKALSNEPCRPFDKNRKGLNLGEAAACLILEEQTKTNTKQWIYEQGSMHNDANHISGPSRTGEGSWRCLQDCLEPSTSRLAFVSVHGTGTLYNDEMEAIALNRAGLSDEPIWALKGYFGHTMGAAGVLETILSMQALEHGQIPASLGFEQTGTTIPCRIANTPQPIHGDSFIKLLSGFGGCNAAVRWCWK